MKIEGSYDIPVPREKVWAAFLDPATLAKAIPGVTSVTPKGAFYVFPNVSGLFGKRGKGGVLKGSADVCAFLLDEARIATVAGVDFGSDAHIRLSYATGLDTIKEGMRRMAAAVGTLQS